jgi:deazaflavin-dependent oxidoreductase (nitroreductase family)
VPSDDELKQFNRTLIEEFRAHEGQVSGWHSLLLLTTIGARSGQPHTTPLVYSTDGDRIILIAAYVGAPRHPAWYHNLLAHPEVTVELSGERLRMRAVVAEGHERERLFNQHAEQFAVVVEYQGMTARRLPVVVLERVG